MIDSVGGVSNPKQVYTPKERQNNRVKDTKDESTVIVDIGHNDEKSAVYKKENVVKPNTDEIKKLWQETEKATQSLRDLVEKLLARQGKSFKQVIKGKESLDVDDEARLEAQKLISEDGELGVKQVSQRIAAFAKAISGGDKSKIPQLRSAIEQGFKEAEKILGELPEISQKTYDEVMNQLDKWEKEE